MLIAAPRVVQAFIAGLGDYFTWLLATKIYPDGNASSFVVSHHPPSYFYSSVYMHPVVLTPSSSSSRCSVRGSGTAPFGRFPTPSR